MKYFPQIIASITFPFVCLAIFSTLYGFEDGIRDRLLFAWIIFCLSTMSYHGDKQIEKILKDE